MNSPIDASQEPVEFARGAEAHVVASPGSPLERRVVSGLAGYLEKVLGRPPAILDRIEAVPLNRPAIVLRAGSGGAPDLPDSPEGYVLRTGSIQGHPAAVAAGATDRGVKRAVQRLVMASEQRPDTLRIPALDRRESPWIPHREWTMCCWWPHYAAPYANKKMNIFLYSEEQRARYVEMFDWFGYSGGQLIETGYSQHEHGSAEAWQHLQKAFARELRANGQDVTLWVHAAYFIGDGEITYTPAPGLTAFDDANVRRGFEKYYNRYAALAPDVDRLIAHFYDPGALTDVADVFRYMRLLEGKFRAANPRIEMAMDGFAAGPEFFEQLVANGFTDYLLLAMSVVNRFPTEARVRFHELARQHRVKAGVWGWDDADKETDQIPGMFVNARLMRNVLREIRDTACAVWPLQYWSACDAHHLSNVYSHYAMGQLLWDPDRDPHELLREVAGGMWGPLSGAKILDALELIQNVRTGDTWRKYYWQELGTESPDKDLARAETCLAALDRIAPDPQFVPKIPMPFPPDVFTDLMRPHLEQIRQYAEFRVRIRGLRKAASQHGSKEALQRMLADAWQPIPDYDTWVGLWGQMERRAQYKAVRELEQELGVQVPDPGWLRFEDAERLRKMIQQRQRESAEPFVVKCRDVPGGGFYDNLRNMWNWTEERYQDRFRKLLDDGVLEKVGEDTYRLANWTHYALHLGKGGTR